MHEASHSPDDTRAIAARVAQYVREILPTRTTALVIALRGELGAGKTTFTQGLAHALGIQTVPKSPTFLLAKEYPLPDGGHSLWHLDCYRLTSHAELVTLDLHRIFEDPRNIVIVEWPENISDGLPKDHLEIRMSHAGGDTRNITLPATL